MILETFFSTGFVEIPEALSRKADGYLFYVGVIIFISFLILSLVKRSNQRAFVVLFQLFFNSSSLEQKMKESLKLTSFASIFLLINYLIIFSICTFLLLDHIQILPFWLNGLISLSIPMILVVVQVGFAFMVNWITGANLPMASIIGNTLIVLELSGVLLSVLALIWILNPESSLYLIFAFISIVAITQLFRVLKNSYTVLSCGVGWYYILLYFCTLEILPLFVAYYYVQLNFLK